MSAFVVWAPSRQAGGLGEGAVRSSHPISYIPTQEGAPSRGPPALQRPGDAEAGALRGRGCRVLRSFRTL